MACATGGWIPVITARPEQPDRAHDADQPIGGAGIHLLDRRQVQDHPPDLSGRDHPEQPLGEHRRPLLVHRADERHPDDVLANVQDGRG